MKIAILNQYALPAGSAGITRHGDIGRELVERGHAVTVIASSFDYLGRKAADRPDRSAHDGVEFVWLRTGAYVSNDSRRVASMVRYGIAASRAATRISPPPDVIIGSSPSLMAPVAAQMAGFRLHRPWVFEVRDFWPSSLVDLGAISRGGITHRALERVEKRLYRTANAVVTVPPRGALRLNELGIRAHQLAHIPNSAIWPPPPGEEPPPALAEMIAACTGRFTIVYAGALGVTHDLGTLIDAVEHLADTAPDVSDRVAVLLIGDGVDRQNILGRARRANLANVMFHRAVSKAVVRTVLEQADAGLMHAGPSAYFEYGLSPNKMFDYMAAGKPVLIAAAQPTIADEANAGIRYQPGDPQALAGAIRRSVEMPEAERAAMGERGRELVRTQYSTSAVTDQYEKLLDEVVERHRHR